jgi:hypothetical protein
MKMSRNSTHVSWCMLVLASLAVMPACARRPAPKETSSSGELKTATLPNGLYAVIRGASTPDSAGVEGPGQVVLLYDRKYTDADSTTPPEYLALDTTSYVPLILSGPPEARKDEHGWTMLNVTLAREQVKPLEVFSRAHLGGKVAILLDGEVISTHKVRSVIEGGQLQITRCGDNACDILRAKLTR